MMDKQAIDEIFSRIPEAKVAIYGDFCLDVYWTLDPKGSEVSVETGIPAQSVAEATILPRWGGKYCEKYGGLGRERDGLYRDNRSGYIWSRTQALTAEYGRPSGRNEYSG